MWNHRVVRRTAPPITKNGPPYVYYEIHEVYYDEQGMMGMTQEPINPHGESLEDLKWVLEKMLASLEKPVIDYDTKEEI